MKYETKQKIAKFIVNFGSIMIVLLVLTLMVLAQMGSFEVYKKKHGNHMTYWDYMIDSERKH